MIEIRLATALASALSFTTILVCFIATPMIYSEIQSIWRELDTDMAEFKTLSDELWTDMMKMGGSKVRKLRQAGYGLNAASIVSSPSGYGGQPSSDPVVGFAVERATPLNPAYLPQGSFIRGARPSHFPQPPAPLPAPISQGVPVGRGSLGGYGPPAIPPPQLPATSPPLIIAPPVINSEPNFVQPKCNCDPENRCPAGPAGAAGAAGEPGFDGEPGEPGFPGKDPRDMAPYVQDPVKNCYHCPPGPQGPHGPPGRTGVRGMRGPNGQSGTPGRDGRPGSPGTRGHVGAPGVNGRAGPQGTNGTHGTVSKGTPGHRGARGHPGPIGEAGQAGRDAIPGREGTDGPRGLVGNSGFRGQDGKAGPRGYEGTPGDDAEYCPCPRRPDPPRARVISAGIGNRVETQYSKKNR